jgi:hypothetical protein
VRFLADPNSDEGHYRLESFLPFILALVLILGFLVFVGKIICWYPSNLDLLKTVATIFLGPIGTILGFYFGQRPVERLTLQAQKLIHEVEERKRELETQRIVMYEEYSEAKDELEKAKAFLEKVARE